MSFTSDEKTKLIADIATIKEKVSKLPDAVEKNTIFRQRATGVFLFLVFAIPLVVKFLPKLL